MRAAQVTPLPAAPPLVLGVIEIAGRVLPVFDMRARFGLPQRPIGISDHFLIARAAHRQVVLIIDMALGIIEQPADAVVEAGLITQGLEQIRGVLALEDGLVLIQDLDQLLTPDDTRMLDEAFAREQLRAG